MVGLFSLIFKGSRFIFILLSLEMLMMSMIFEFSPISNELSFMFLILFSVLSSVTGVLVLVKSLSTYGGDMVLW